MKPNVIGITHTPFQRPVQASLAGSAEGTVEVYDSFPDSRAGWLDSTTSDPIFADDRFEQE